MYGSCSGGVSGEMMREGRNTHLSERRARVVAVDRVVPGIHHEVAPRVSRLHGVHWPLGRGSVRPSLTRQPWALTEGKSEELKL